MGISSVSFYKLRPSNMRGRWHVWNWYLSIRVNFVNKLYSTTHHPDSFYSHDLMTSHLLNITTDKYVMSFIVYICLCVFVCVCVCVIMTWILLVFTLLSKEVSSMEIIYFVVFFIFFATELFCPMVKWKYSMS